MSEECGFTLAATLLGPVGARLGSAALDLGPPKQRAVFAVLAANPGRIVPQSDMIRCIWGRDGPDAALSSVYAYVARLRKALSCSSGATAPLVTESDGYRLDVDPSQVDIHVFRRGIEQARRLQRDGDRADALVEVERALALWQGTPMAGLSGPFAELERGRLEQMWLDGVELRCSARMAVGQFAEVVTELTALIARFPLRESLTCTLMQCHVEMGQRESALAAYHALRAALSDELGIGPGETAQRQLAQVLSDEPARWEPAVAGAPEPETAAGSITRPAALARRASCYVGQDALLSRLSAVLSTPSVGSTSALGLITGPPGIGKTALAGVLAHRLADRFPDGQVQLDLGGFGPDEEPMSAADAVRLLHSALTGRWATAGDPARCAAEVRGLLARRNLLIVLDNAASVEQVRGLLPTSPGSAAVVTSRLTLSGLAVRDGAVTVVVPPLAPSEAADLFRSVGGVVCRNLRDDDLARVVHACAGLPLAVRTAAARVERAGSPARAMALFDAIDVLDFLTVSGDPRSCIPDLLHWSYRALPEQARTVLVELARGAAGYRGGRFAHGWSRPAVDALVEANLVEELAPGELRAHSLLLRWVRRHSAADVAVLQADGPGSDLPVGGSSERPLPRVIGRRRTGSVDQQHDDPADGHDRQRGDGRDGSRAG